MAIKTYVDGNSTLTVSNNDTTVIGAATGTQTVNVAAGVTGVSVDANIEKFTLTGNLADYKFVSVAGTGTQIQNAAGTVVATIPSLNQTASVTFADGAANLVQTGASSFTLGGQTVPTTANGITAASMGSNFTAIVPTITLASSATSVNEGSTVTYTVTSTTAAPTGGLTIPYTLAGTATNIADYTGGAVTTGNIIISAGQTTGTLTLTAVADSITESGAAETIILTLGTLPTGHTLATGTTNTTTTAINDTSLTVAGQTFTLTQGADTITGTAGNDTINAFQDSGAATFNAALDQVNGGAGTDTLTAYGQNTAASQSLAKVSNVESFIFRTDGTNTASYDMSTTSGYTNLSNQGSATALSFLNIGNASTVLNVQSATGDTTFGFTGAALVGSSDSVTVNVDSYNASAKTLWLTPGIETLTLNTSGSSSNFLLYDGTAGTTTPTTVSTLNMTGSASLTLGSAGSWAALKTVNASSATGGLSINMTGTTIPAAFAFTGGSGNDTLKLAAGALALLTSGSQINGGAGTGDKVTTLDTTFTTANYTTLNAMTGIEVLGTGAAAAAVDASKLTSIKSFAIDGNGIQSYTNMPTGSSVSISVAHAATLGFAGALGVSDLAITYGTSSTTGFTVGGNLTIGQTAVTISSNGTNAASNIITTLVNTDNSTYTISGANNFEITNALAGTAAGSKMDASALTGTFKVLGSAQADSLIGGFGADTIASGGGADTINGNGGNDSITGGAGAESLLGGDGDDSIDGAAAADVINGGTGNDTIIAGTGADTLTGGAGIDTYSSTMWAAAQSIVPSATSLTATIANNDTITFATGAIGAVDQITDFTSGTDKLDVATANTLPTSLIGASSTLDLANDTVYSLLGTYVASTGVFTVNSNATASTANVATLLVSDTNAGTLTPTTSTDYVLLIGVASLAAADFI